MDSGLLLKPYTTHSIPLQGQHHGAAPGTGAPAKRSLAPDLESALFQSLAPSSMESNSSPTGIATPLQRQQTTTFPTMPVLKQDHHQQQQQQQEKPQPPYGMEGKHAFTPDFQFLE